MKQNKYIVNIRAVVYSILNKEELENKLVVSLLNINNETNIHDGETEQLEVVDYYFTEAV